MINNIIEIWYWTIMLIALIGVVLYFSVQFVRDIWATLKQQLNEDQIAPSREQLMAPYSRRMVIIHWLTLALLLLAWYLGDMLVDARMEKAAPLLGYFAHALLGMAILLLTALRLIYRGEDGTPPLPGNSPIEIVGRGVHFGLYILLILLSVSGFMTLLTSAVGLALVTGDTIVLPSEYAGPSLIPHMAHKVLFYVLIAVVAMHMLGAARHQFIIGDGLMRRMWFGGGKKSAMNR